MPKKTKETSKKTSNKVTIRFQRATDAKAFYDILDNDNFKYFSSRPKSVADEKKFLIDSAKKRKRKESFNFAIMLGNKLVGGCGFDFRKGEKHLVTGGYFIDEEHWGKGIAVKAMRLVERFAFKELKIKRFELLIMPKNKGSIRVAEKLGYKREGLLKKYFDHFGKLEDAYMYAKVK